MRTASPFVFIAMTMCVLLAVESPWTTTPDHTAEIARIQDHLARAAAALRSADTDDLDEDQREARRKALGWLDEYRETGVFPHNHVRHGQRVPVFVDPHGTPCAVGYLMLRSGQHDLVEEIVRTDNLVRVQDLRDDARVAAWLSAHGLTLAEAAVVQPMYGYEPPPPETSSSYSPATVGLSVATAALASYTAMRTADSGGPWMNALTFATSVGHTYLLLHSRDTRADEPTWAVGLNVVGLAASIGSGVRRMVRGSDARQVARESSDVRPFAAPGRYGTEVGLVVRH